MKDKPTKDYKELIKRYQAEEAKRAKAKTDSLNNVSVDQKTKQRMADIKTVLIKEDESQVLAGRKAPNLSTHRGRVGRIRFLYNLLGIVLFNSLFFLWEKMLGPIGILVALPLCFLIYVFLVIKRLHDFNFSGWWCLLFGWPLINIVLCIIPGTKGVNQFGKPLGKNSRSEVVLSIVLLILYFFFLIYTMSQRSV